ncbi:MAG: cysteine--tRNA ligase [Patescibacteria group bacterium]
MEIRLYNTLSRVTEAFKPLKEREVGMYHCGPTVYDTPHIGNYRTFVMNDLLRRVFEYNTFKVTQVMNITDVDDKTIRRSKEQGKSLTELTHQYENEFLAGLDSLHIHKPHKLLRATESIELMIALISSLLEKEIAYKADDGVYIHIDKVKEYGKLANLDLSKSSHERITNDEYDKENPRDFAVWKFHTSNDGDISWKAPFGDGRPGWHIECSAMAMNALGPTIDIHTGGQDLIFPHHTNEIAQSESVTGKQYVRYWMHGAFIDMNDEKMAKSKGNVLKLEDLVEESISPLAYRYWLLTAHYRSPINFTFEAVLAAQTALIRLIATVREYHEGGSVNVEYQGKFQAAINNDLDLPKAVALVWEILKDKKVADSDKRATILDFDKVFGLDLGALPSTADEVEEIPVEVQALADAREEARKEKDWAKADALRNEIKERGFEVIDSEDGVRVRSQ